MGFYLLEHSDFFLLFPSPSYPHLEMILHGLQTATVAKRFFGLMKIFLVVDAEQKSCWYAAVRTSIRNLKTFIRGVLYLDASGTGK